MNIHELSVTVLKEKLENKELSSHEIVSHFLSRIETDRKKNDRINAFIEIFRDKALKDAAEADKKNAAGNSGELLGIPLALKDNLNLTGFPTTCGSKILEGYNSIYDACVVTNLKNSGTIFLGKTNMDEFAMGSSNETSTYGIVRNPADRSRIPGGSSGGSASSIAAGFAPISLGSDTGGSIRQPASHCGVVGMKPTYGRVSRYGLVAYASSLDQIGPFAKNIEDAALLLKVISGYDNRDSTSADIPVPDYTDGLEGDLKGKKIGIPSQYFTKGISPEVETIVKNGIDKLKDLGAEIIDISLPHTEYAVEVYYIIATAEASSNLARFDGIRYGFRDKSAENLLEIFTKSRDAGFGDEVKRRILLGTYVLSSGYYDAYYLKALKARTLIKGDFDEAFKNVDAILTPVSPTPAFKIGEKSDDPVSMYLSDIFTISANLAGIPGISLNGGYTQEGLPVGIQLLGSHFQEHKLLKIAHRLEKAINI